MEAFYCKKFDMEENEVREDMIGTAIECINVPVADENSPTGLSTIVQIAVCWLEVDEDGNTSPVEGAAPSFHHPNELRHLGLVVDGDLEDFIAEHFETSGETEEEEEEEEEAAANSPASSETLHKSAKTEPSPEANA